MDAVLTCMVDERIGPGELNARLIQGVKDFFSCSGAAAFRSPAVALEYALKAAGLQPDAVVMVSALAPSWHASAVEKLGYKVLVLDVDDGTGLVTPAIVSDGMKAGGTFLLLHETFGIMPDMDGIRSLGVPFIEDISQSAGASYIPDSAYTTAEGSAESGAESVPVAAEYARAGSFGMFAILGLEERDVITGGGGAVLMAPGRREWIVLKKYIDEAPLIDLLPDLNSALAYVQIKEYKRNEAVRKDLFTLFLRALLSSKNKTYIRSADEGTTASAFPVILAGGFKDAKQYTSKKDIEIRPAYEDSVIAGRDESLAPVCKKAHALLLRCVLFPLYPRLGKTQAAKIVKVLGTLP